VTFSSSISTPACSAAMLMSLAVVSQFLQPEPNTLIFFISVTSYKSFQSQQPELQQAFLPSNCTGGHGTVP
jgi:Na+/H+ antiporter NhaD/arsenite permease-like protein